MLKSLLLVIFITRSVIAIAGPREGLYDLVLGGNAALMLPTVTKGDIDDIWKAWDEPAKRYAKTLSPEARRNLIYKRYGFEKNPFNAELPLGLVKKPLSMGTIAINCTVCHSSRINGELVYGLPNWRLDLKSFVEDLGKNNPLLNVPLQHVKTLFGPQRGLINPIGEVLFALTFRDPEMNLQLLPNRVGNFDEALVDPLPWWNMKYKTHLFSDAAFPTGPRIFITVSTNPVSTGSTFRKKEEDVLTIFDFVKSIEPPRFPQEVEANKALAGKAIFGQKCIGCHGGEGTPYPNKLVPLHKIGTDPERADGPDIVKARAFLANTWVGQQANGPIIVETRGYIAPPLKGIWASAPYLHNGSVPTLWHLMHPEARPTYWLADEDSYDYEKMGLKVKVVDSLPGSSETWERRRYYDTTQAGRRNIGHDFFKSLSEAEKSDLLEYLKTL